ncbi:hypothetical protein INR49_000072 [Caranx melampygus]|nr:hypothetical protein INR49_000072 [Caranx melampygus]
MCSIIGPEAIGPADFFRPLGRPHPSIHPSITAPPPHPFPSPRQRLPLAPLFREALLTARGLLLRHRHTFLRAQNHIGQRLAQTLPAGDLFRLIILGLLSCSCCLFPLPTLTSSCFWFYRRALLLLGLLRPGQGLKGSRLYRTELIVEQRSGVSEEVGRALLLVVSDAQHCGPGGKRPLQEDLLHARHLSLLGQLRSQSSRQKTERLLCETSGAQLLLHRLPLGLLPLPPLLLLGALQMQHSCLVLPLQYVLLCQEILHLHDRLHLALLQLRVQTSNRGHVRGTVPGAATRERHPIDLRRKMEPQCRGSQYKRQSQPHSSRERRMALSSAFSRASMRAMPEARRRARRRFVGSGWRKKQSSTSTPSTSRSSSETSSRVSRSA